MAYRNDKASDQHQAILKSNFMVRFFGGLTIGGKLGLGFGLLILLIIISGSISYFLIRLEDVALRRVVSSESVTILTEQMRIVMEETHRLTETFLEQNRSESFEAAVEQSARSSLAHIETLRDLNNQVQAIEEEYSVSWFSTEHHHEDIHLTFENQLVQYEQLFDQIVETTRQRDLKDSGTGARFLAAAQALQASPTFESDKQFRDTVELLRRYEQWILRTGEFNDSYIVDGAVERLRKQVVTLDLSDAQKAMLLDSLDTYLKFFNETLVLDAQILDTVPELNQANESILELIDDLNQEEEESRVETVARVKILADQVAIAQIGSLVGTVMVAGALAFIFTRSITGPVAHLSEVAQQVAQGNLSARAIVSTRDEIGQFADIFNRTTAQLGEIVGTLESQVAARTQQLETVVEVSQGLTGILDLAELNRQVVNRTKETFGYYHTHIYLLNDEGDTLVMAEGYGAAGAQMKQRGHNIRLDAPTSLVARAARNNEIVRVDDVRQAPDWLPNPLLPDTRAEMAVPVVVEEQVVGVLDVQADRVGGLDEGDANLLRSLSNQVAVAIRNARLFEQVETALAEARAVQERYIAQAWQKGRITAEQRRYIYTRPGTPPPDETLLLSVSASIPKSDHAPTFSVNGEGKENKRVVVPLRLYDTTIGTMHLYPGDTDQRPWTKDDMAIIQAVVDQFVQTAENLRLFDETQQRAARERLARQITDKVRSSRDIETALQIAAQELNHALGASKAVIDLELGAQPQPDSDLVEQGEIQVVNSN